MRELERVERVLRKVGYMWVKYPDLRLCQLLYFILETKTGEFDLFNIEDSRLEEMLEWRLNGDKKNS